MAIVYKITNTVNGKIYIGYTKRTLERRWAGHCKSSRNLTHKNGKSRFMCAIRKYGIGAFVREILIEDEDAEKCLNYWEPFFIAKFNSTDPAVGYNGTTGGGVMYTSTPEIVAKKSAALKASWADPEAKARRRAAAKAMWLDPEYVAKQRAIQADPEVKAKQSAAMKKLWADPEYVAKQRAMQADPEVKAKQSAALKAAWADPEAKARLSAAQKERWRKQKEQNNVNSVEN